MWVKFSLISKSVKNTPNYAVRMADSSLDDFFAKKDKSKKKGKSKVTPNDLLEKQKVKKKKVTSDKSKEDTPQQLDVDSTKVTGLQNDDEEWLDVQEEEKDYTGLRIQNLQIAQERDESEKESEDKGSDEDEDESGERREGASGPWGKKAEAPPAPVVVQKPPEPEPVVEPKKDEGPVKPAKYVPPGARQSGTQSIGPGMGPTRRRGNKSAPNLQSEEDFPTLGGEGPVIDSAWGSGNFERVKSGGKQMDDSSNKGPQLSLGNKYTALGTD